MNWGQFLCDLNLHIKISTPPWQAKLHWYLICTSSTCKLNWQSATQKKYPTKNCLTSTTSRNCPYLYWEALDDLNIPYSQNCCILATIVIWLIFLLIVVILSRSRYNFILLATSFDSSLLCLHYLHIIFTFLTYTTVKVRILQIMTP